MIGLVAAAIIVGLGFFVFIEWFSPNRGGGSGSSGTTGIYPPVESAPQTINMYFYNRRAEPVWIVPTYGSATDNLGWTTWTPKFGSTASENAVQCPHTQDMVPMRLEAGVTGTMKVFTGGMASINFLVRVGCDDRYMICKYGDSAFFPGLDGVDLLHKKRDTVTGPLGPIGPVPFKPAINTIVEMTWGCAYENAKLCAVNPSCITDPTTAGCNRIGDLMAENPTAKFGPDGFLYNMTNGENIPLQLKDGTAGTIVGALDSKTYFDISCVDGFTVPIAVLVKRPASALSPPDPLKQTRCRLAYSGDAPILDNLESDPGWQLIANTLRLGHNPTGTSGSDVCPTGENLVPAPKLIKQLSGTSVLTDGYNFNPGQTQYPMPYRRSTAGGLFKDAMVTDSRVDLHVYRDPIEVTAMQAAGHTDWNINQVLGCASPCSILTKNDGNTQMFPKLGGQPHANPSWLFNPNGLAPSSSERGVAEICAKIPPAGIQPPNYVVTDTVKQVNTSTWWYGGATTPLAPNSSQLVANYAFGFYVNVFAPKPNDPWYVGVGTDPPGDKNPYKDPLNGGGEQSKYVLAVREQATGQTQTTHAYSYAHDDSYATVICDAAFPRNIQTNPDDSRGSSYSHYDVLVEIHEDWV